MGVSPDADDATSVAPLSPSPVRRRILFLLTRDWLHPRASGGDIALCDHARYMAKQGHDVVILAARWPGAKRRDNVEGVEIIRFGRVELLSLTSWVFWLGSGRRRFDLVVEEGFGASRLPRFAPLYVDVPLVTVWHQAHTELIDTQYPPLLRPLIHWLERFTAIVHRGVPVYTYTASGADALSSLGFDRNDITVIPCSIPDHWFDHPKSAEADSPVVIWLGKFRRYKCPDHVVEAFAKVLVEIPSARLLLVGRHEDRAFEQRLERQVRSLGLTQHVEFHFAVDERKKRELIERAQVMVVPSSVEGFGIVILEANARGVPVVASSGVPLEVVADGRNGRRYQFADVGALAERLVEVLSDADARRALSAGALSFATAYRWDQVGGQFERLVQHAVERGTVRRPTLRSAMRLALRND